MLGKSAVLHLHRNLLCHLMQLLSKYHHIGTPSLVSGIVANRLRWQGSHWRVQRPWRRLHPVLCPFLEITTSACYQPLPFSTVIVRVPVLLTFSNTPSCSSFSERRASGVDCLMLQTVHLYCTQPWKFFNADLLTSIRPHNFLASTFTMVTTRPMKFSLYSVAYAILMTYMGDDVKSSKFRMKLFTDSVDPNFSWIALLTRSWSMASSWLSILGISWWPSEVAKAVKTSFIKPGMPAIAYHKVSRLTITILSSNLGRSWSILFSSDITWYARTPTVSCDAEGAWISSILSGLPASCL